MSKKDWEVCLCVSQSFRSSYGRLSEIRALVPSTSPVIALTATVKKSIREDVICILEMDQVSVSANRSNIYYEVRTRNNESLETDMWRV